jgi:hypothetical protein
MLRHGVSLAGVGSVLCHGSPSMTALYAKVDIVLLSEIAQPCRRQRGRFLLIVVCCRRLRP